MKKEKVIKFELDEYDIKLFIKPNFNLPPYKIKVAKSFRGNGFVADLIIQSTNAIVDAVKGKDKDITIEVPFPMASILFVPKIRHEKIPIPPDFTEMAIDFGSLDTPTFIEMKYKEIIRDTYGYTLPSSKMLDCLYTDYNNLEISKTLLYSAFIDGMEKDEKLHINPYIAVEKTGEIEVDSFYALK